jgi:chromosome segregation ATPase
MSDQKSEPTLLEAVEALLKVGKSGYYNPHTNDCVFCWHDENESETCADNCEWLAVEKAEERERNNPSLASDLAHKLADALRELEIVTARFHETMRNAGLLTKERDEARNELEESRHSSAEKAQEIADLRDEVRRGKAECERLRAALELTVSDVGDANRKLQEECERLKGQTEEILLQKTIAHRKHIQSLHIARVDRETELCAIIREALPWMDEGRSNVRSKYKDAYDMLVERMRAVGGGK